MRSERPYPHRPPPPTSDPTRPHLPKPNKHHDDRAVYLQVMSMWLEGDAYEFRKAVPRQWVRLGAAAKVLGAIKSPMPGKIIQVICAPWLAKWPIVCLSFWV